MSLAYSAAPSAAAAASTAIAVDSAAVEAPLVTVEPAADALFVDSADAAVCEAEELDEATVLPLELTVRMSCSSVVSSCSLIVLALEMSNILASAGSSFTAACTSASSCATVSLPLPLAVTLALALVLLFVAMSLAETSVVDSTQSVARSATRVRGPMLVVVVL